MEPLQKTDVAQGFGFCQSSFALKLNHVIFQNDLIQYSVARLIPGLLAIVSLIVLIQQVPAEQLGIYILVTAGVGFLQIVLVEWLKAFLVRAIASYSTAIDVVSQAFRYLKLVNITVVFLGCVGFILLILFNSSVQISGWIVVSSIFLFMARAQFELEIAVLNANLLASHYLYARVSRNALQLLLFWGLTEHSFHLAHYFVLAQATSYAMVSLFLNKKHVKSLSSDKTRALSVNGEFVRHAMSFGLPVSLSLSIEWIVSATDKMLIGKFMGLSSAGQYGAIAEIMIQVVTLCFVIPYMALYPRIIRASQQTAATVSPGELFRFHGSLVIIGVLALGMMSTVFPRSLAELVWGDDLATVVPDLLLPLTISLCFFGLKTFYIDILFHVYERTDLILQTSGVVAFINVFGNLFFIPIYGLYGAAWVSAISMGVGLVFSLLLSLNLDVTYYSGLLSKLIFAIASLVSVYLVSFFLDDLYRTFIVGLCACLLIILSVFRHRRLVI